MKLTESERLILANQYEILAHLKSDTYLQQLADNLKDGHEWIYEEKIRVSPILSEDDSEYVVSVLELYEALQDSYDSLTNKASLTEEMVRFRGFDGNNESAYLGFYKALVQNGQFAHIKGDDNSHMPTGTLYNRQLNAWAALDKKRLLTAQEIKAIL